LINLNLNNLSKLGIIRPYSDKLTALFRLLDSAVIGLTLWSILTLDQIQWESRHTWWLLISVVSFEIFAELNELYRQNRGASIFKEIIDIVVAWSCVIIVMAGIFQVHPLIEPVYINTFWKWAGAVPIEIVSWHIIVSMGARILRRMGRNSRRVAIVGATQLGKELCKIFMQDESMGLNFTGFFDDRRNPSPGRGLAENITIAGNIEQLTESAKAGTIDIIYITLALSAEHRIKHIIEQLADSTVTVYYVPDFFAFSLLRSSLHYVKDIPIISIHDTPFYGVDGVTKRIFDALLGCVILTLVALPMLLIGIAVKFTSPGPAIFKQRRYGFRGEEIIVWKFRSMTVCEDDGNVEQAKKQDPRVTRLGAFLRRTSLDELPQFINVLQGRMSIVGPRPHAVAHNEWYRRQIKGYMLRHKVKPGITGLAQINGYRGETDTLDKMESRVHYDLAYIRNWSLWLDIKIVLLTVVKGFGGAKAY
jgi:putative colanic acid biosynthesis UDP-glucose lipid carrier transferase